MFVLNVINGLDKLNSQTMWKIRPTPYNYVKQVEECQVGRVGLFLFTTLYPCPSKKTHIEYLRINSPLQKTCDIKLIIENMHTCGQ
jgi:hypothetical protein